MSTIKSSNEHLTLNADGSNKSVKFQANGVEKASISSAGVLSSDGGSTHADNVKAKFGTGNDLEIYHDGTDSYIKDTGSGDLYIQGSSEVQIESTSGENMVRCVENGTVELFHNNVKKFETTSTGATVTGYLNVSQTGNASGLQVATSVAAETTAIFQGGGTGAVDVVDVRDSGGNTKFKVRQNGRVGINDSSPGYQFAVTSSDDSWSSFLKNNTGSTPYGFKIQFSNSARDNNIEKWFEGTDTGGDRIQIMTDGDVRNHDNSYGAISDERIKQNITDANSQWDDIKAIKVRNYKRKDDVYQYGENAWEQIGVVAQEVELISPKLITESPPSDFELEHCGFGEQNEDGDWVVKKDSDGKDMAVKAMNYSILYMKSIKALQEAMARIETLEAKVAALEA